VADTLARRLTRKDLTERELAVLKLIVRGRSNKEISVDLNISERTVKYHLAGIFEKLQVLDRTQAAIEAVRHGLVQVE
jgi:DNA-binding NarL/FixJ family response regulator